MLKDRPSPILKEVVYPGKESKLTKDDKLQSLVGFVVYADFPGSSKLRHGNIKGVKS